MTNGRDLRLYNRDIVAAADRSDTVSSRTAALAALP